MSPAASPPKATKKLRVSVRVLPHGKGLPLPGYQTAGSAGMDLVAAIGENERVRIAPGRWALIPTGIELALPRGTEAQVRPRSGLAARHGVTVLNSPGTIDSDYRGEVSVILINLGRTPFPVHRGDRIAQLVVARVEHVSLVAARELKKTTRGRGGFGSTGVKSASNPAVAAAQGMPKRVRATAKAAEKAASKRRRVGKNPDSAR